VRHLLIVSLIGCGATAAAAQELERSVVQPPFSLAAVHAVPDAEGKPRLVALGRDGSVRRLEPGSGESEPKFLGELTLPALDALLYDFAEVLGDGGAP